MRTQLTRHLMAALLGVALNINLPALAGTFTFNATFNNDFL